METGVGIKIYLVKERISQKALAEKTGISQPKISSLLNGKQQFTVPEYALICGALDIPVDMFLKPRTLAAI